MLLHHNFSEGFNLTLKFGTRVHQSSMRCLHRSQEDNEPDLSFSVSFIEDYKDVIPYLEGDKLTMDVIIPVEKIEEATIEGSRVMFSSTLPKILQGLMVLDGSGALYTIVGVADEYFDLNAPGAVLPLQYVCEAFISEMDVTMLCADICKVDVSVRKTKE
jgi:hypothetical protein